MKGKITDSFNKKAFRRRLRETEWDARKWRVSQTKTLILEFLRKNNMRKLWQTSKGKIAEESIKSMKSRKQNGSYSKCIHMRPRRREAKNCYTHTNWMTSNKCCGILFVDCSGQVHYSITIRKIVVVFFHYNYDYFILCDNQNLHNFAYRLADL